MSVCRALAVGLAGCDFYAAATKFVMQEPGARDCAAVLLRRFELPVPRRLESDAREVGARTVRGVFGTGNGAAGIYVETNDYSDCAMNCAASALGNDGNVTAERVSGRRC